jgi:hypothetical protein
MPCEIIKVAMKPVNFFDRNPALDVPPSSQDFNKSTLLSDMHHQVRSKPVLAARITTGADHPSFRIHRELQRPRSTRKGRSAATDQAVSSK